MRYGIREICEVVLKAKTNHKIGNKMFYKGEPVIYFDSLKTSTLEGATTTVYATGGRGNARLMAWEGERTVTFTMEDALISPLGLMILTGAGLVEGGNVAPVHTVEITDAITYNESSTQIEINLKNVPSSKKDTDIYVMIKEGDDITTEPYIGEWVSGKVFNEAFKDYEDSEIETVSQNFHADSLMGNDVGKAKIIYSTKDNVKITYKQYDGKVQANTATLNQGEAIVLYNSGDFQNSGNIIYTLEVGPAALYETEGNGVLVIKATPDVYTPDLEPLKNATTVLVDFYVDKPVGSVRQIEITPDSFGGNFYLEASTLFRATTGEDHPAEFIIPNCKIQSNFSFAMASSGDPSTFTFTMDAFPDYTHFDLTKKVICAIQVIDPEGKYEYKVRTATAHDYKKN